MTESVSQQWGDGGVLDRILDAIQASGISPENVSVEALAPVDHFHARGFLATKELADSLPIKTGDHLIDIGCGIGGLHDTLRIASGAGLTVSTSPSHSLSQPIIFLN